MSIGYGKVNNEGYLMSSQIQEEQDWVTLDNFDTDAEGNYYAYYNQDGTPDTDAIAEAEHEEAKAEAALFLEDTNNLIPADIQAELTVEEIAIVTDIRAKAIAFISDSNNPKPVANEHYHSALAKVGRSH